MSGWIFLFTLPKARSTAMLHGAKPEKAVSARGPIAIRYRSLFSFLKSMISTVKKTGIVYVALNIKTILKIRYRHMKSQGAHRSHNQILKNLLISG